MRCLVGLASVTLENLLPNIVSKDEKDVGSLIGLWTAVTAIINRKIRIIAMTKD